LQDSIFIFAKPIDSFHLFVILSTGESPAARRCKVPFSASQGRLLKFEGYDSTWRPAIITNKTPGFGFWKSAGLAPLLCQIGATQRLPGWKAWKIFLK
jgi:hypothetical protein